MDFEAPDKLALYSSNARRKRFYFCPVGYWLFHAEGQDGYLAEPESWKFLLYRAKFMIPLAAWSKSIFRRSLREFYPAAAQWRNADFAVRTRALLEREFLCLERGEHRRDPKIAAAIMEVEHGVLSLSAAYDRLCGELDAMLRSWRESGPAEELRSAAPEKFRNPTGEPLSFPLGGVTFLMAPDLVWRDARCLNMLDCGRFAMDEDRKRSAALFRAFAFRHWAIPPERVRCCFYDPADGRPHWDDGEGEDDRDFAELFRQLAGEAGFWRDYLVEQTRAAAEGRWLYPRREQCGVCRFAGLCPAEHAGEHNGL